MNSVVYKWIEKRVFTIVFKCLHNIAPCYLQSLLIRSLVECYLYK
jgi:hypothetical protein